MRRKEALDPTAALAGPKFSEAFQQELDELFRWRRDVRRFRTDPLPDGLLERLVERAEMAPSVGLSQPWRFVRVKSPYRRKLVVENFEAANREALSAYTGEQAQNYAQLKLAGLREAPEQLAVFADTTTSSGAGLGRRTMPQMLQYSVVCAVHMLWLAARAQGVGVGWVSIFDPEALVKCLGVPESWDLVAYLCIGYPVEQHTDPELDRQRWERRNKVVVMIER